MRQADLDRAVARATGETVATVKRLGFLLADPAENPDPEFDELDPLVIDWDDLAVERNGRDAWRPRHVPAVV